ncbi:hypothetical protein HPP92_011967 [Vanilla planifolia]|uniref:Uncharacterized protein n=1 Tax=Vanilla planifolia TaxID=51239 RepID=A0A835R2U1_VANPL|nr:hypothetical protein HPP92_011967 [Vanilla planifolia]
MESFKRGIAIRSEDAPLNFLSSSVMVSARLQALHSLHGQIDRVTSPLRSPTLRLPTGAWWVGTLDDREASECAARFDNVLIGQMFE